MEKSIVGDFAHFEKEICYLLGKIQRIESPLYDTMTYRIYGDSILEFFAVPVGMMEKTQVETSMWCASQLPEPQAYWIDGISVKIEATNILDQVALRDAYLELLIGSQSYFIGAPLNRFEQSGYAFKSGYGIGLMPRQNFKVIIRWPRKPSVLQSSKIRMYLHGWLYRPVI